MSKLRVSLIAVVVLASAAALVKYRISDAKEVTAFRYATATKGDIISSAFHIANSLSEMQIPAAVDQSDIGLIKDEQTVKVENRRNAGADLAIMLVSVTERTREIGIRMAIGARGSDVLTQFLVESIVMSSLGGLIGVAVGLAGVALLGHFTGWSTATPPIALVVAVGFSAAVGVFFGFYPARKAAALNPIQALRYE